MIPKLISKLFPKRIKVIGLLPMEMNDPKLSLRAKLAILAAAVATAATAASQFLGG